MTRGLVSALSLLVVSTFLSPVLSGPACLKKYQNSPECMSLCKPGSGTNNWGFGNKAGNAEDGLFLGLDPWGIVLSKSGKTVDEWIADACGLASEATSSTLAEIAGPTVRGGVVDNSGLNSESEPSSSSEPAPTTTSSVAETTSSTSTPPPEPTTTSTPPPPPPTTTEPPPPPPTTTEPPPPPPPTTTEAPPPPPATTEQPPPPPPPPSSGGSDRELWLSLHNNLRAQHNAPAMTWSDAAEAAAQQWANNCQFKHSGGSVGPFGENLAAGTGDSYNPQTAFQAWADEESEYNPSSPKSSHYTQVVWRGSTQLGCALAMCDGIFDGFGQSRFYVCEYAPQGNVVGQFAENVQ